VSVWIRQKENYKLVLGESVLRFEGSSPGIAELAARAREEL